MDFSYLDDWQEKEGGEEIEEMGEGHRNVWVVLEAEAGSLLPDSVAVLSQARELADQVGAYVFGLLLGQDVAPLAETLIAYGADRVLVADDPSLAEYQPRTFSQILEELVDRHRPEILLMAATARGNDLMPYLAQRLGTGLISHCTRLALDMQEGVLLGTVPIMGGQVYHTFACPEARPQMATLEPGYFRLPHQDSTRSGSIEPLNLEGESPPAQLVWLDLSAEMVPSVPDLSTAPVVVSAGRGLGDAEGFALLEELAAALGGVVAGSRGAYDEGWIGQDQIVGIGGRCIAPRLYLACGISGDIYHSFGLQEARYVLAINTNEQAPIMKVAHMAVVGDVREILPALLERLDT